MFEQCVGMEFEEVVAMVSQLEGLVDADEEYGSVFYSLSSYGWESADVYEFVFEDGVCVEVILDEYEED